MSAISPTNDDEAFPSTARSTTPRRFEPLIQQQQQFDYDGTNDDRKGSTSNSPPPLPFSATSPTQPTRHNQHNQQLSSSLQLQLSDLPNDGSTSPTPSSPINSMSTPNLNQRSLSTSSSTSSLV